ncbi:MAG: DUF4007 family protein [Anaerolineales bacterium]|nr:DUF4007 family protein [Anaerolineales bacterium]
MGSLSYKLQLTKGFFVDFGQIARLLAYAVEHRDDGRIPPEACATSIGISTSRVKNLSSLAVAFGLIRPVVLTPTELGSVIHRRDPFLDDLGTLWLLHYLVSSNERYVVWNRLVNRIIPENDRFSTAIARPYFDDLSPFYSERSMDKHLRKEMGAVWNAYTSQAFRHLRYIRSESDQIYVRDDHEPVPPRIFWAAVLSYRERFAPGAATLDVSTLAGAPNSPGRVFDLTGRQVRDLLEEVKALGYAYVETRADLDQVRFRDDGDFLDVVRRYYEEC